MNLEVTVMSNDKRAANSKLDNDCLELDDDLKKRLDESIKQLENGEVVTFSSVEELRNYFKD